LKNLVRILAAAILALGVPFIVSQSVYGAPKKGEPSPAASDASSTPAPLPSATPEPPESAIPRLEAQIKANPNDKDALQELAGYYLGAGKNDQALALTQRLISLGAKTAQVYFLDGVANQSLGRIKDATSDFEAATTQEPTNAQILLTLTNLYLQTNRAGDAERVAKRATTFNPNDKRVYENYGLVLGQEGKFDDARTQFEAAEKIDPKDATPIVLEARSYVSQKAIALAAADFDRALTVDPKSADALLGKASLQAGNHDVKGAIATFEQLFAIETDDDAKASVLVQEYQVYRNEKMNDEALAALKRAETAYPNVAGVHLAYGDYDVSLGNDKNAGEAEWKQALGPARDNPQALDRLGELAISENKKQDALGYFKRLNEVVPNDPGVLLKLGQIQAANSFFRDARTSYLYSFQLQRTPQALAGLGTADLELKNYKECNQVFGAIDRNAQDFLRANPTLLYVYGKCALGVSDKNSARSAFLRFKPFVRPGTALWTEVTKTLASLGSGDAPKPAHSPSSHSSPSH